MKRALVIFGYPFAPTQDGGARQMEVTLELLRGFGLEVTFATMDLTTGEEQRAVLERLGIPELTVAEDEALGRHLEMFGGTYDLVWLCGVSAAMRYLQDIKMDAARAKLIFETTDLQSVRLFRRAKLESHAGRLQVALKTKAWEVAATRAADVTLVVSENEREILRRECPDAEIVVHGLVHEIAPAGKPFGARRGIVFVGSFPHHPNEDAMRFYFEEIYGLVERELDVPLWVVGPQPPEWLTARASEKVRVTGHVPTVAPYLEGTRVSIAPLRYGAGVKGKVIESMGFGVPVVATTVAAEGTGARDGEEILIADTPAAFAEAVVRVHEDAGVWERLAANGRALVERDYTRAAARGQLEDILKGLGVL